MEKLPPEIKTNILARLPFRSIAQCKSVSKPWYTLLSDPAFHSFQLTNHLTNPNLDIILVHESGPSIYYLEINGLDTIPVNPSPFKVFDSEFICESLPEDEPYTFPSILGAYNGFICLSVTQKIDDSYYLPANPIWVVNPITEERFELPLYSVPETDIPYELVESDLLAVVKYVRFFSGFGFEDSRNEFKLVLIMFYLCDHRREVYGNEVQVHTLGSDNWRRKVGVVPEVLRESCVRAVFVSGCLHWVTVDVNSSTNEPIILSFDLCGEEFGDVSIPKLKRPYKDYRLGVFEDCLSFVESSNNLVQIWIMQTYGIRESWVKRFSIKKGSLHTYWNTCPQVDIIKFCKNGKLLLLWNGKYIVAYDVTSKRSRYVEVKGVDVESRQAFPFVGSLLSLDSACRIRSETEEIRK
ncbi:hypothetical protein ACHQM5_001503 [Ranunculus cassubicifolius]